MAGFVVIGEGAAGKWSADASAVEPRDADLLALARERGLYETARARGACDALGNLLGEGWLLVVGDHVEESDLDGDPAVIAYCTAP